MKYGMTVVAMLAALTIALAVPAQELAPARPAMGKLPATVTTAQSTRVPVQTIKMEVPVGKALRQETPSFRGENLFLQRCSICHLGEWRKGGPVASYGPHLSGTLKDASREPAVRAYIQFGSAKMPGFANTFSPSELDDLISYLKSIS